VLRAAESASAPRPGVLDDDERALMSHHP